MADSIRKYKFSKIKRFYAKIEPNKLLFYRLTRKNNELNYKLIKYIWKKNSCSQIENNHWGQGDSDIKSNCNIDLSILFWKIASELKNNEELKSKLNTLLNKITTQPEKKHAYESLEISYAYGTLYYNYLDGSYQQDSVINFIKKNLDIILSQGKLKKTKTVNQEQAETLIKKNKEVLDKITKQNKDYQQKINLKTRKIIFKKTKQHIKEIHKNEQVLQNTKKIQQVQQEVDETESIMRSNIEKVIERKDSLKILQEKAKALQILGEEFDNNIKKLKRTCKKNFHYPLIAAVVAAITVIALICYICTTFSSPNQSLDNVMLQNIGELMHSIT